MKYKLMSAKQRVIELTKLITDGVKLGFATPLMMGYQRQLTALQEEVTRDREKSKIVRQTA